MEEDNLLDQFLAIAESISDSETNKTDDSKTQNIKKKEITKDNEDELFLESIDEFCKSLEPSTGGLKKEKNGEKSGETKKLSLSHNGDTDSSDDESNRDYQNRKYNEYGREIKHLLTSQLSSSSFGGSQSSWKPKRPVANQSSSPFQKKEDTNVITDPFFGIRISNPLISSAVLKDRMADRRAVTCSQLKEFVKRENNNQDWVIAGVIVSKSPVKISQKGNQYLIWTLSDLKNDLKTCAIFLFGSAYKQLWKTSAGSVLGVLNPSIMETRDGSKDEASLSVDNAQKVMIFGTSKDLGTCKSRKKDGQPCSAFVNKNSSEYCLYHIKSEYQKLARRSELQANFVGGGLTALRNKVLGKNEVFYAGKSYMAIPAKKNTKMAQKDNDRLRSLGSQGSGILAYIRQGPSQSTSKAGPPKIKTAATFDVSKAQRIKDLQLLQKLKGEKVHKEKEIKGLEVDFQKSALETEKILKKIEHMEKKLSLTEAPKSLIEIDFLSETPKEPESTLKPNNSKLTEDILKDLDNLDSNLTTTPRKTKIGLPRTPNSSKKRFEKVETELLNMFESPKDKLKIPQNDPNTPENQKTKTRSENKNIKTPTTASKKASSENREDKNKIPSAKLKKTPKITPKIEQSASKTPQSLKDTTNSQKPETLGVPSCSKNQSILKNSKLDTEELNDLATKSKFFSKLGSPKLSVSNFGGGKIDLTGPIEKSGSLVMNKAKLNALRYVQRNGQIKKEGEEPKKQGVKRFLETTEDFQEKRQKLADESFTSERFKKIMALQSKHTDLLNAQDLEEEEKYFRKLEVKEKMEEKMATVFKVDCKAVRCLTCKYEAFSAADNCKQERHVLKVIDAVKRFFKCAKCGYRTVTLKIIPLISCTNCRSSKWDRTTMMKEKIVQMGEKLSIRGLEEKHIGHANTGGNINLLVPDK